MPQLPGERIPLPLPPPTTVGDDYVNDAVAREQALAEQRRVALENAKARRQAAEAAATKANEQTLTEQQRVALENAKARRQAAESAEASAEPRPPGFVRRAAGSVPAGLSNMSASIYGLGQAGAEAVAPAFDALARWRILPENPAAEAAVMFRDLAADARRDAKYWQGDLTRAGPFERGVYSGVQSLAQNVPVLAAAALTRNPEVVALSTMGGLSAGQSYSQARAEGAPVHVAQTYALGQGVIEAATERIPVGTLFKDLAANSGFAKVLLRQILTEIPTEQIATHAQDLNTWAVLERIDWTPEHQQRARATVLSALLSPAPPSREDVTHLLTTLKLPATDSDVDAVMGRVAKLAAEREQLMLGLERSGIYPDERAIAALYFATHQPDQAKSALDYLATVPREQPLTLADIPSYSRRQIVQYLESTGQPVTDLAIIREYRTLPPLPR